MAKPYTSYGQKYLKAGFVFVCHLALIALVVTGIYGLEQLFHAYWGDTDHLLFDRVPLKYPFQFIDLVLILFFGGRAVWEMYDILKE
jgi:hypothetical protein